jgi:(2Fe-2S) ferredoxin
MRLMPHRDRYLFICTNRRDAEHPKGSCAKEGAEQLVPLIKEGLAKRGMAKAIRACSASCLDLCEIGAAIVQEPEHVAYGRVTAADVPDLLDALARGEVLERLVVHRPKPSSAPARVAPGDAG